LWWEKGERKRWYAPGHEPEGFGANDANEPERTARLRRCR